MPLDIELWIDDSLVSGIQEWWDDIEIAAEARADEVPLLRSISPYDDRVMSRTEVARLRSELALLEPSTRGAANRLIEQLIALCDTTLDADGRVELRFRGD